jgi:hypothetical protein
VTEEDRELMINGLLGLRRVRDLLPGNPDVSRGIEGIQAALGDAVPQRTAARALGVAHPEVSKLISSKKLRTVDNVRGKAQIVVESLLELIEEGGGAGHAAALKKEARNSRLAEIAAERDDGERGIDQIMEMRALAFLLVRPVSDVAAKMVDYSTAGVELRKSSPFNSMGRRADD